MSKLTRRAFIVTGIVAGGGLAVGIALRPGNQIKGLAAKLGDEGAGLIHTYVKIDSDNVVTAVIPHSEMGQGAQTALAQMLAEELDADWDQLRIEEAPAIGEYAMYAAGRGYLLAGMDFPNLVIPTVDGIMMRVADSLNMQITGGSMSVRTTGALVMRTAGAATREMLQQAAADAWSVPLAEVITEKSHVIHAASNRREPYASFAAEVADMTPSFTPTLKDSSDYKIVGTHKPRHDIPGKVDGSAQFAMDVQLPNMLYATVVRSPVSGGSVAAIDDSAARAIAGVVDVIVIPEATVTNMLGDTSSGESVAVVADSYWSANKAIKEINVQWTEVGF